MYEVIKATIPNGGTTPTAYARLRNGAWETIDGPIKLQFADGSGVAGMRVFFPATFQGVTLAFNDTYIVDGTPVSAGAEDDARIMVEDADSWASKSRTIGAEAFTMLYVQPVLLAAGGAAQAQSQSTDLIFVLRSAS